MMKHHELNPIADYCVKQGIKNTKTGKWSIPLEELKERFKSTYSGNQEQNEELCRELMSREEINELIMTEDCIEMAYHMEYCPECQQGGIAGAVSVLSVMGCNVSDEHETNGRMQSLYGICCKHGREAFLEAAEYYSGHVDPESVENTIYEMNSRWYDRTHTQSEAEKMLEDYNNGLTILNDCSLAYCDAGQSFSL